jgi:Phospholipase_D-nuclease N-terminal
MTAKLRGGRRKTWRDLTRRQRRLVVLGGIAEAILTTVAARDLATRDPAQLRGPKALWAPLFVVQPFGPLAYLLLARRPR